MRNRLGGLLAVLTLVLAACGSGSPQAADPGEGIQVHGHWTIDVYNPDGSLDDHHEFDNALSEPGVDSLVRLLTGVGPSDAQSWFITLTNACPTGCAITDVTAEALNTTGSSNLLDVISLSGQVVAVSDATIDEVQTAFGICTEDVPQSTCEGSLNPGDTRPFTAKQLDPVDQVEVSAGQTIQVQVEISFTSG